MMVALRSLIFLIIAPGTVTVLVPYYLLKSRSIPDFILPGLLRWLGVFPMGLGALVLLWCFWDFTFTGKGTPAPIDPPKVLVVRGLYRWVRNPMYVGIILILGGEALFFGYRSLLVYAALFFVGAHLFVVLYEEPTLRWKFGPSYDEYCRSVPRWVPQSKSFLPHKK